MTAKIIDFVTAKQEMLIKREKRNAQLKEEILNELGIDMSIVSIEEIDDDE